MQRTSWASDKMIDRFGIPAESKTGNCVELGNRKEGLEPHCGLAPSGRGAVSRLRRTRFRKKFAPPGSASCFAVSPFRRFPGSVQWPITKVTEIPGTYALSRLWCTRRTASRRRAPFTYIPIQLVFFVWNWPLHRTSCVEPWAFWYSRLDCANQAGVLSTHHGTGVHTDNLKFLLLMLDQTFS